MHCYFCVTVIVVCVASITRLGVRDSDANFPRHCRSKANIVLRQNEWNFRVTLNSFHRSLRLVRCYVGEVRREKVRLPEKTNGVAEVPNEKVQAKAVSKFHSSPLEARKGASLDE